MSKIAVMAFSGGMDSTGLLVHLLAKNYEVHTLSYDYGQKHKLELDRAKANIQYLSDNGIQVSQKIVDLQSAMSVFHSALTTENYEIPISIDTQKAEVARKAVEAGACVILNNYYLKFVVFEF